ncbi:MAG: DNA methyltransferase [Microcystis aeruginosa Ma_MB_F_20061100_S19]|uniref:site-specific DNA-methyltransferase (adenine-specific) n=1 Tax=Microcystis aeruginosa SPC777 TaxID=482300 RepID=S3IW44_MICAE|nr:type ISP restriction/modification enzyme [Microcystis aeruginosa]NCR99472.1 N-6 DNA methylase [Microcystis aeruginosa L311-01]OCY12824.1 MAG: DNA methyltransferase [Microcystis aeruginosa CACIAM 03]TRU10102.1 MAG: DNA methyltransferase [Microcystis aeruginosa Ma_MB_F_20061100_S19]TRU12770.1 MAG: DNA methyltransferase [Microcystis aeruginosa Ma_MB_F_20061100_S19D]EPF16801.1 putative helicase [Microcystis aeruginosa SPC777]
MSRLLISQYQTEVEKIVQYGGSRKETSIRVAFQNLLNDYCKARDFLLIPELDYRTKSGKVVYPDGTVKDALRLDWGYWESKDQYDNLDEEIEKKLAKGYPNDNILFEDSQTAVLIQGGEERLRVSMRDDEALDGIINAFINYVRPEVNDFREAIDSFKEDLPTILEALRGLIALQSETNRNFVTARDKFLEICRKSINPEISLEDVREMIIQHILTEDIFINIFNESQFHRENNIARELQGVIETFFTGNTKRNTLGTIERYYAVIRRTAANIYNHHEKQKFLKAIYENFYKAYNPKAADRLGIVYTPNEIVRFMIESVDYLVHKHFGKLLADPGVEILDPATGTGTFVTELIEYLPKDKLRYKYKHEMHCNEVAILPYYIANLNIEFTYKQKMGEYEEFEHICFVDTLDYASSNIKQMDLFAMSVENTQRIHNQNDRNISVIIGNPPYNAKQENFNQDNANRSYEEIDKRIKYSYVKEGKAQNQIVVYDMYTRFIRWASDRLNKNGIIAFVSNSSFIDALAYDGFRKVVADEFNEIWIVDAKGNARNSGERRRREGGNVFSDKIKVGIAVYFLVRNQESEGFKIFYNAIQDYAKAEDKQEYFRENTLDKLSFQHIIPDKKHNWLNQSDNDFNQLLPLIDKEVKSGKSEKAVFKLFSSGIKTQRDEWVYDFSRDKLEAKMRFFVDVYQRTFKDENYQERNQIKWDGDLTQYLSRKIFKKFDNESILTSIYRPYIKQWLYFDKHFNGRTYQWYGIYKNEELENRYIIIPGLASPKNFYNLASSQIVDLNCLPAGCQCLPLYYYEREGNRIDNITDWGLQQFQKHYNDKTITKLDIFHYTYAVLHYPEYRSKYELNLKREFPRLPFYDNFSQWVEWGSKLMELHINYETVAPYPLTRIDTNNNLKPKTKLKADREKNSINLDDITFLQDIPKIAWEYKLGNRSALEWILDQYKEKKPKDQTIAERFNNYRFADYKETVIDLLQRVCTVSVETMKIIEAMRD